MTEPARRAHLGSLGESLIDFTPRIEGGALSGFDLHPGGSPCNVAVGLARLGQHAHFGGRVSDDLFGHAILRHLRDNGVAEDLLLHGHEPATLAFVAYEGDEAVYSFRGEGAADRAIRPGDFALDRFLALDAVNFGSISLLFPPASQAILELVRALHGNVTLTFDPNIRKGLVPDWPEYRVVVDECFRLADIVKISDRDLETLADVDPAALAADHATSGGPVVVIVTRGSSGSRLFRRGRDVLDCPSTPCTVVDTVGAGDAYTAGLVAALAERDALGRGSLATLDDADWLEVMAFASTTSALTCERAGSDPPTRSAVLARLPAGQ